MTKVAKIWKLDVKTLFLFLTKQAMLSEEKKKTVSSIVSFFENVQVGAFPKIDNIVPKKLSC